MYFCNGFFACHIKNWRDYQIVFWKIVIAVDYINRNIVFYQRFVMFKYNIVKRLILTVQTFLFLQCTHIVPIVNYGNMALRVWNFYVFDILQSLADFGNVTKNARVTAAVVGNYRTMKFLIRTATFSPLKILHWIWAARNCLYWTKHMNARTF